MADLSDYPSFLASEAPPRSPEEAFFHFIPAPYEKSVSYGTGTAQAPGAILRASQQLEVLTDGKIPCQQGIYTYPPVDCSGPHEEALARITDLLHASFQLGKFPILLGGDIR